ncbi:PRC-barrel domain-containing protein [Microvirga solisilvae]|uniref:PRC-barrel domain-containing protein n=1 Tax=Microvirga solisilvae TaxID=2919498 RepID=UPI001FAED3BC|nr:PRC-barrel domain-containing protein [Microvirga solisilvae]
MKTLLMAGLLGSTLLATGAFAQSEQTHSNQPSQAANSSQFMTQLPAGSMLLSDLMDEDVIGPDNKDIGDVEDVILDRNGKVAAVVIEVEEGIGDRTVALPLNAFQMMPDAETTGSVQNSNQNTGSSNTNMSGEMRLMLNMPVDQLKSAPEFDDND